MPVKMSIFDNGQKQKDLTGTALATLKLLYMQQNIFVISNVCMYVTYAVNTLTLCFQVLSGCGVYDGSEIHEASS